MSNSGHHHINARSSFDETVSLENNEALVWDWRLEAHDISFSLHFYPDSSSSSSSSSVPVTVIPLTRFTDCVTSSVKGIYYPHSSVKGNLLFHWANKNSTLRGKNLIYNLKKVNRSQLIHPYGSKVKSSFGEATILSYNQQSQLYSVALPYGQGSLHYSSLPPYIPSNSPESRESIESRVKVGVWLFFTNHLELSEEFFLHEQDQHPAFSAAYACISYLRAFMTWEKADMDEANRRLEDVRRRVQPSLPKEGIIASVARLVTWSKNSPLTSAEMEAVLMTAESHMLQSQLLLVEENVYSFIQAGLKIRSALALYQRCFSQYEEMNLKSTNSTEFQLHNHTSVQLGMGGYYLILSLMFPSILRLLSFLGFTGRGQEAGLALLSQCNQARAVRSPLAALILLFFHVIVPSFYTLYIEEHIAEAELILKEMFDQFPNSSMFLWIQGRHDRNKRLLLSSFSSFTRSAAAQPAWQQLQHLTAYEKGQSLFCLLQFHAAIPYYQLLKKENQWSKAFYIYMEAIALLEEIKEEERVAKEILNSPLSPQAFSFHIQSLPPLSPVSTNVDLARTLFSSIEEVSQRKFGGRNLTMELYILQRSSEWLNGKGLILPTLEMIYIFNGFTVMNKELLTECRNRIINYLANSAHTLPQHIIINQQQKQLANSNSAATIPISFSQHFMLLLLYASTSHYISKLSSPPSSSTLPVLPAVASPNPSPCPSPSPSIPLQPLKNSIAMGTLIFLSSHETECQDRHLIAFSRFERASVSLQETVAIFESDNQNYSNQRKPFDSSSLSNGDNNNNNNNSNSNSNSNLKRLKRVEYKRLRSLFQSAEAFPSPYHFKNRLHFRIHLARMELKKWKNKKISNNNNNNNNNSNNNIGNNRTETEEEEEEDEEDVESSLADNLMSQEGERDLLSELTEEQKKELELEKPKQQDNYK